MASNRNNNEKHHITDGSGDPKFFVQIPRIVWAYARDPYDLMFYIVIKDVAGEQGECYLSTSSLATLCKMSEGKVQSCREYWLKTRFIQGEFNAKEQLWHMTIANIWSQNRFWAEGHLSIESRIDFVLEHAEHNGKKQMAIKKVCPRCQQNFIAKGRRSFRCPDCQAEANAEQEAIYKLIRMPQKDFILEDDTCQECGEKENLELHLENDKGKMSVLCRAHHDLLHLRIHDMNPAEISQEDLCHESASLPHESGSSPHESTSSPHESKNNHKKNQKNNQKNGFDLSEKEIWERICEDFSKRITSAECNSWLNGISCISLEENRLKVGVINPYGLRWFEEKKPIILGSMQKIGFGDLELTFTLDTCL